MDIKEKIEHRALKCLLGTSKRLAEELRMFQMIANEISDIVLVVDLEGQILYANFSAINVYGYQLEELLTMSVFDLRHNEKSQLIKEQMLKASQTGVIFQTIHYRSDGAEIPVEVRSYGVQLGGKRALFSIIKDITDRKKAEGELRDSETRFRTLFDTAEGGVFFYEDNQWVDCNEEALKIFRCTREEIIGSSPLILSPLKQPDGKVSSEEGAKLISSTLAGRTHTFEWVHCRIDGTTFPAEVRLKRLEINGKILIQMIIKDLSSQKKVDEQLIHTQSLNKVIFESTSDMIWAVDSETFGLLSFNRSTKDYFSSLGVDIMIGMKPEELYPGSKIVEKWYSLYQRALTEEFFTSGFREEHGSRNLLLTFGVLKRSEKIYAITVFCKDLTKLINYEQQLEETNKALTLRLHQSIETISKIGELRDVYTAGHQKRAAELCVALAIEMGMTGETVNNIALGAKIHDVGKIYIASDILNKPGKITDLEYQILQTHPEQGYEVLKGIDFPNQIKLMVLQHHEREDGSGYPQKLIGDQITIESKILAVADVVEAMTSHRPYRAALGIDVALDEIVINKGIKYDCFVVDACINLFKKNWTWEMPMVDPIKG